MNRKLGQMSCGGANKQKGRSKKQKSAEKPSPIVEDMFKRFYSDVNDEQLHLWYAVVGYDWTSGRPIFDQSVLIDALLTYGYDINSILKFIEILSTNGNEQNAGPIVMISKDVSDMHDDIDIKEDIKALVEKHKDKK